MDGTITLTGEEGKGSIFTVVLENVEVASVTELSKGKKKEINAGSMIFEKASILVVDDVELNRSLLISYLEPYGFSFYEAANGQEAVDMATRYQPDLITMDIKMPVMDGFEATKIIKNDEKLKNIPVIAVTASAMKEMAEKIKKACDGYLKKPVSRADLISKLSEFLKHSIEEAALPERSEQLETKDDDFFEDLDSNTLGKLPELVEILKKEQLPVWEKIKKTFPIDELEKFAENTITLGNKYNCKYLSNWGERVKSQVAVFDMENLPKTLEQFPGIILKISSLS